MATIAQFRATLLLTWEHLSLRYCLHCLHACDGESSGDLVSDDVQCHHSEKLDFWQHPCTDMSTFSGRSSFSHRQTHEYEELNHLQSKDCPEQNLDKCPGFRSLYRRTALPYSLQLKSEFVGNNLQLTNSMLLI